MGSSSECPKGYRWECRDKLSGFCTNDCATCPSICVCSALCVSFDVCTGPAERRDRLLHPQTVGDITEFTRRLR